jgi:rhamnosyltransferase
MQYDFLCFVHDKGQNETIPYDTASIAFRNLLWENMLGSVWNENTTGQWTEASCTESAATENYIENILHCMEENPHLGLLVPPKPYHSIFFVSGSLSWTRNYHRTKELAEKLGIPCRMQEEKRPIALGNTFWCKTQALKMLFEHPFAYEDFPPEPLQTDGTISHAVERILPYVAQQEGYYTGVLMTENYAAAEAVHCRYMLEELVAHHVADWGDDTFAYTYQVGTVDSVRQKSREHLSRLSEFCKRHPRIYIYGAGMHGKKAYEVLMDQIQDFQGFVVSDGKTGENKGEKFSVWEVSELSQRNEIGIIVAMTGRSNTEILRQLFDRGFLNVTSYVMEGLGTKLCD